MVKLSVATVPEVDTRFVTVPLIEDSVLIEAMLAMRESPVAFVKPKLEAKRLVLVVLVPVAFTQVMSVRLSGPESTRFSIVAVVAAKTVEVDCVKRAEGEKRFVIVDELLEKLLIVPAAALKLVTNKLTPVPDTKVRSVIVPLVETRFVKVPVVALIVVAENVVTPRVSMMAEEA